MKKLGILILLAALACSLLLLACKEQGNVKYFRHLRMYKIHDLDFTYPVDPKDYKKINCFAVEYDEKGRIVSAVYLQDGERGMDQLNQLSSIEIQYSENNEKWSYRDLKGESVKKYVEYESYDFDSTGKLLSCSNLSEKDEIVEDTTGVAKYVYTVDSLNDVLTSFRLNNRGDSIIDAIGYCMLSYKYDAGKNKVEVSNFDKNGKLLCSRNGVAIDSLKYDKHNRQVEASFYDNFYNRTLDRGLNASIITYDYDSNGNMVSVNVFDENHNLLFDDSLGYAYYIIDYDKKGNVIKITYYDADSNPTFINEYYDSGILKKQILYSSFQKFDEFYSEEYSYHIAKFNTEEKIIEGAFYNSDGTLYETGRGFATIRYRYGSDGKIIERGFYSSDGKLAEDKVVGWALEKFKYIKSNDGELIEESFYDADGKLITKLTK